MAPVRPGVVIFLHNKILRRNIGLQEALWRIVRDTNPSADPTELDQAHGLHEHIYRPLVMKYGSGQAHTGGLLEGFARIWIHAMNQT